MWLEHLATRSDVQVVGCVDIDLTIAQATAAAHRLDVPIANNLPSALRECVPNLVINTTIPQAHTDVTVAALQAGCDVLVEKPLALTPAEARHVIETADRTGRSCSVMQNFRYSLGIRSLRSALAAGRVGTLGLVSVDFFMGPHFGGFRDEMANPLVLDMAVHTFDMARYLTAADGVSARCVEFNPAGSWYRGDATAICTFEMSDGTWVSYRGSWCSQGLPTSWEGSWRVTGSEGTAHWDGTSITIEAADSSISTTSTFGATTDRIAISDHGRCLNAMLDALAEDRKAETDCRDNFNTLAMVFAALESSEQGGTPVVVEAPPLHRLP